MLTETQLREVIGATAYTRDGDKLGKVGQLFLDDETGRREFVTVNTGLFGTKESFVPVTDASLEGDRLTVPYSKDQVKDAPSVDSGDGHIDPSEEERIFQHYGLSYSSGYESGTTYQSGTGYESGTAYTGTAAEGRHVDTGTDDAMTRSEERLEVGTARQEAGRARLRKYVTTETETQTVPVRKERAVVETEPITDGNVGDALSGPEISEDEHEVVLQEERPVVEKTAEPVERVRLAKEAVSDQETVSEEVRKEQIEVEGDADRR